MYRNNSLLKLDNLEAELDNFYIKKDKNLSKILIIMSNILLLIFIITIFLCIVFIIHIFKIFKIILF